jgi:hypothetical protein
MKLLTTGDTAWRPNDDVYVRSYLMLRLVIGGLMLALPPLLIVIVDVFEGKNPATRGSMSAYYYTGARDLFVGVLCVVGVFLIGYKLRSRRESGAFGKESRVTTFSGAAAVVVAFFPTDRPADSIPLVPIQNFFSEDFVKWVHYSAAASFILSLAYISFYFAHAEGPASTKPKGLAKQQSLSAAQWQLFHNAMGLIVVVAVVGCGIFKFTSLPDQYALFVAEWMAVWAFGFSWVAKGAEWRRLNRLVTEAQRITTS